MNEPKQPDEILTAAEFDELGERVVRGEVSPDDSKRIDHVDLVLASGRRARGSYRWDGDWLAFEVAEPTIELIIERINAGSFGYRVIDAGAGWAGKYLWEDRDTSLCTPAPTEDIRAKAAQLGII